MPEKLTALTPITLPLQAADEFYVVRPSEGLTGSHSVTQANMFAGIGRALPPITDTTPIVDQIQDLQLFTILPNTLINDGDYFQYGMYGAMAQVGNVRRSVTVRIGGQSPFIDFGNLTINAINQAIGWSIIGMGVRVSSTLFRFNGYINFGTFIVNAGTASSSGNLNGMQTYDYTVTPSFYSDNIILVCGAVAADNVTNDPVPGAIVQNLTTVVVFNFT